MMKCTSGALAFLICIGLEDILSDCMVTYSDREQLKEAGISQISANKRSNITHG